MIGQTVAHFRVVEKLGEGGMGEVYLARDTRLGRTVALKFLSERLAQDEASRQRFLREARAIAALNHPHICTVHETGEHAGRPYFAMEHLEGRTLQALLQGRPLETDRLLDLALQMTEALGEAHAQGILHRDLKPANVFVDGRGCAKLLDFGLAKNLADAGGDSTVAVPGSEPPDLTQPGTTLGTVQYMSPEQVRGEAFEARSDLFSLGVVLYEMATGRSPFEGRTTWAVFDAILRHVPEPARRLNTDLPSGFERILQRLLEKDAGRRYPSAVELRAHLASCRDGAGPGSGAAASSEAEEEAAVTTLGVRPRSRAPIWILLIGSVFVGAWLGFAMGGVDDGRPVFALDAYGMVGIAGVAFAAAAVVLSKILARRPPVQIPVAGARLVRLGVTGPKRRWRWLGWPSVGFALLCAVFAVESWRDGNGPLTALAVFDVFLFGFIGVRLFRSGDGLRSTCYKSTEIELRGTYPKILRCCSEAVEALGARVTEVDVEQGRLGARTAATFRSWGERLTFEVKHLGDDRFSVEIASDCVLPFTLTDYGKNSANLNRAMEVLVR